MANILVVDDDEHMRVLIKTILARRGHHVIEARDGLEGLARFNECLPELVLTDIVMPRIGGLALLSELQRSPAPPKVLLVSGKRSPPEAEWSVAAARGQIRFLPKPFTPAELGEAVRTMLEPEDDARLTA